MDSEFFAGGVWTPTFLVTLNLRSNIFQNFFIYRVLWTLSAVDSEFFAGGSGYQFFLVTLNLRSNVLGFLSYAAHCGL